MTEQSSAVPEPRAFLTENPLQADDEGFDDGASLNSYENGRRYHAFREGSYFVPNDEEEQGRMDLVHHIYRLILGGKLYLSPLKDQVGRVLDMGTGTGIWAMDFADEHPEAEVLGTDLSPIQPNWVPPNCIFEIEDFESDWLYGRPFDFVFGRELEACIADDRALFRRVFENLKPGGYFEMQGVNPEFLSDDDTAKKALNANKWMQLMVDGAAKFGKPFDTPIHWKEKFIEAGFVDVKQEVRKLPIGAWPKDPKLKEIGRAQSYQELQVIDSYTPGLLSRGLGWSAIEINVFMPMVRTDLKNPDIHLYLPVYFVWGRKP
ncbi:methyltransferase type 12 [Grosmannia clavigera kw1407]|uniref:Methyltransferase type 12 n=1 Tax=Grosmannia clavigera (strain kw1407 / UAMH 11150) TaxID=655863 RepID=F0XQI3_GROCL|nr:methyltransferase type 12 [Grosmannia clavigera kw1407]EFX00611.1 methyltransferase type 12 [Grosmannia clavigera kw1407]